MDKKEKLYKTVANSAIWNLVMGIVVLVTGITSGVLLLISAVRLMSCLLYTSPSPRDPKTSRMPSSA